MLATSRWLFSWLIVLGALTLLACDDDPPADGDADADGDGDGDADGDGDSDGDADGDSDGDGDADQCEDDEACDDGLFCTGEEQCDPDDASADEEGCVAADEGPCEASGQLCSEDGDACVDSCPDADGDSHTETSCGGDDCDDDDAQRYPGNVEVCDAGHDEDCNPATLGPDGDGDGFISVDCCNGEACGDDCADGTAEVNPGATEVCNGEDEDCDGERDEGVLSTYYVDGDGDGFGDGAAPTVTGCTLPAGYAEVGTDCDDTTSARNPGLAEVCDGLDNDCDTRLDGPGEDDDGDGYADSCADLGPELTDCDDGEATIYPGAPELCNGVDDDCDGALAAGDDHDGDGQAAIGASCVGGTLPAIDCDDAVATTYDGAPELCNGVDDDCDERPDFPEPICDLAHASASCVSGSCEIASCDGDFRDCDELPETGCESDRLTDEENCGACGTECDRYEVCSSGACTDFVEWAFSPDAIVLGVDFDDDDGLFLGGYFDVETLSLGGETLVNTGGCRDGWCPGDLVAARLDPSGAFDWVESYGGAATDEVRAVAADGAGGLVLAGVFVSGDLAFGSGTPALYSQGDYDLFVASVSGADGAASWAVSFGGFGFDSVVDVAVDASDDVIVAGHFESSSLQFGTTRLVNSGAYDIFVAKLDGATGAPIWARRIGGAVYDVATAIAVDPDGNVDLVGTFAEETLTVGTTVLTNAHCFPIGAGEIACTENAFVAELSGVDGTVSWAVSMPGESQPTAVDAGPAGELLLACRFTGLLDGVTYDQDFFVAELSGADGTIDGVWPLDQASKLWVRSIHVDADRLMIGGSFQAPTLTLGDATFANASDCWEPTSCGNDLYLWRVDRSFGTQWATVLGGDGSEDLISMAVAADGRLALTGDFSSSTLDLGVTSLPGPALAYEYEWFVASIDAE